MSSNFWLYSTMALALSAGACSSQQQPARDPQPADPQPAEAQPAEAQTAEAQPAEAQPVEAQPVEAQRPYQGQGYPEAPVTGVAGLGPAPDAVIVDAAGEPVSLARLWQSDNVLLVFYRGHW